MQAVYAAVITVRPEMSDNKILSNSEGIARLLGDIKIVNAARLTSGMSVVILFGAGASAFSGPCHPHCPPLGKDLLSALREDGPPVSELESKYADIFNNEGFEKGMKAVWHLGSRFSAPLQRQIAKYLSSFEIKDGNHYIELLSHLVEKRNHICFASLNYDVLLEQAINKLGIGHNYEPANKSAVGTNYKPPKEQEDILVMKLHGSSNFLPKIPLNWNFSNNSMSNEGCLIEGNGIEIAHSHARVREWCDDPRHGDVAPAMCLYAEGKNVLANRMDIEYLQACWKQIVLNAKLVVLVGVGLVEEDTHIWESIKQSNATLAIVDPEQENVRNWSIHYRKQDVVSYGESFKEAIDTIADAVLAVV